MASHSVKVTELRARALRLLWSTDLKGLPRWQALPVAFARILVAVGRDLVNGGISLRAMSLVYTTIISLVPLLAFSFSVLKGFGVHNQIRPLLESSLAPLGDKGIEITDGIIGFVNNIDVGVLGTIGLGFLIYTVVAMMQKIESCFNHIWRVVEGRSLAQKFSDYLSVILVGPLLIFVSIGLTASLQSNFLVAYLTNLPFVGDILVWLGLLVPYFIMACAFAFMYAFVPNTKVKLSSALVAGMLTAIAWQAMSWMFAEFIATASSRIAIYSAFASVLIFMLWLYLGWLVLLIGASVAYYWQHPRHTFPTRSARGLSNVDKEQLALTLIYHIGHAFQHNETSWTREALRIQVNAAEQDLDEQLQVLSQSGLIYTTNSSPPSLVLAKAPENIPLDHLLTKIRQPFRDQHALNNALDVPASILALCHQCDQAIEQNLAKKTLKHLLLD